MKNEIFEVYKKQKEALWASIIVNKLHFKISLLE